MHWWSFSGVFLAYLFAKGFFFRNLQQKCVLLGTLLLPSDCWDVFEQINLNKKFFFFFFKCTRKQRKRHICGKVISITKKAIFSLVWKMTWQGPKSYVEAWISNNLHFTAPKLFLNFHSQKQIASFSYVIVSSKILTCTNSVELGECQDRFGGFHASKKDSDYWAIKFRKFKKDYHVKCRLVANITFRILTSIFHGLMRWSKQPRLLVIEQSFSRYRRLRRPRANNKQWSLFIKWLVFWDDQKWRIVSLCCNSMWTSQRVLLLKPKDLQARSKRKKIERTSMWNIHLTTFYVCLG